MTLVLANILDLDDAAQMRVRELRNQEGVRKWMYSEHPISEQSHRKWLAKLAKRQDRRVFAVYRGDEIIGSVHLTSIAHMHRRAEWAFCLDETMQGQGLGTQLEIIFLNYVFENGFEKLNCEVLETNEAVIRMHERFGFVREGMRREHVIRDGRKFDVVLLGITKDEWTERKKGIANGVC